MTEICGHPNCPAKIMPGRKFCGHHRTLKAQLERERIAVKVARDQRFLNRRFYEGLPQYQPNPELQRICAQRKDWSRAGATPHTGIGTLGQVDFANMLREAKATQPQAQANVANEQAA